MGQEQGVSAIIPCFNDGRYIRQAVESVYAQDTELPFEIIIIDDGSTDALTLSEIAALEGAHPDLHVIRQSNKGLPSARNAGIQAARYDYIFPLDSDDKLSLEPDLIAKGGYIDRAAKLLAEDQSVAFAYCKLQRFGAVKHSAHFTPAYDEKMLLFRHMIGSMIVFRREEGMAIGGYNPRLLNSEDWDFNIALLNARIREGRPAKVHRFEERFHMYRQRGDGTNISSNQTVKERAVMEELTKRNPEIYAKHFPGLSGEALINRLVSEGESFDRAWRKEVALEILFNPLSSYQDGVFSYLVGKLRTKLRLAFGAAAPPANAQEYEPSHQAEPEAM